MSAFGLLMLEVTDSISLIEIRRLYSKAAINYCLAYRANILSLSAKRTRTALKDKR